MLRTRVMSAIVLVLVLGALLYFGGLLWWVLLLFISFLAYHEYCRAMMKKEGEECSAAFPEILGVLCIVAYYAVLLMAPEGGHLLFVILGSVLMFMAVFVIFYPKFDLLPVIEALFGILYAPFMLSFLYLLRIRDEGITGILLVVVSSWISDTFAYFTGRLFGRHKLSPILSPGKSVEGAVGGVVFAAVFGWLLAVIASETPAFFALAAGFGAVISQIGDLFASGIKRSKGIKDFGDIIPGHGGILDRFDSVIMAAPVIYLMFNIFRTGTAGL